MKSWSLLGLSVDNQAPNISRSYGCWRVIRLRLQPKSVLSMRPRANQRFVPNAVIYFTSIVVICQVSFVIDFFEITSGCENIIDV